MTHLSRVAVASLACSLYASGVVVTEAPPSVQNAQTLYDSWSAFYPGACVMTE